MGNDLVGWDSESCPVSHVVQLHAELPLAPARTNLFLPKLGVSWAESHYSTSLIVTFNVPIVVSDADCRVDGGNGANW